MSKSQTDNTDRPTFTPRTSVDLKLQWPEIYPDMVFSFDMRIQLVEDAEKIQQEFLMLPDAERTADRRHQMDARMLGLLSKQAPKGFPDFEQNGGALDETIYNYLYPSEPGERREGLRFICRQAMAKYWSVITPADYL